MNRTVTILLTTAVLAATMCGCAAKAEDKPSSWTIDFDGNATTGYSWESEIADEAVLTQTSAEYVDGNSDGAVGAGGVFRFTFDAAGPGTTTVTFSYARSWETVAPLITAVYEVTADEKLTITAKQISYTENKGTAGSGTGRPTNDETLLQTANDVAAAMKAQDFSALADYVHPEKGVTFTPYSAVNFETDRMVARADVEHFLSDDEEHHWGAYDGSGEAMELTNQAYWDAFVWNTDYSQADQISANEIVQTGNSMENLQEAYPDAVFVDYHFDQLDPQYEGMDWCSLKLVFEEYDGGLYLVGVVHGQWTI